jgi:porin
MKSSLVAAAALAVLFTFQTVATASAQGSLQSPTTARHGIAPGFADDPQDPRNQLKQIENRAIQTDGLIPYSPIQPVRDGLTALKDGLYDATHLKLGLSFHHLFQGASDVVSGAKDNGAATDMDFVGTWALVNRGTPTQGELGFGLEGRWEYGYGIGPQNLGFVSLASSGGSANTFAEYNPNFILRNLYYRQGGPEAGWVFRVGKITTDAMLLTNRHITPNTTYLPNAGTGVFAAGFADSGPGIAGAKYFGDRLYVGGAIADANGDRFDYFDDLDEGDFYKGLEVGLKIFPRTEQASFSKFLLWHTDGTFNGKGINASTGADGWGFAFVVEQELTANGRLVLVGRYGRSYDKAAIYDEQLGVHLLFYEPTGRFDSDVIGAAFNWVDSAFESGLGIPSRNESNLEVFYRFPLLPDVDTTLSYQALFDPAFANTPTKNLDFSSVFSLRATSSF